MTIMMVNTIRCQSNNDRMNVKLTLVSLPWDSTNLGRGKKKHVVILHRQFIKLLEEAQEQKEKVTRQSS